MSESAQGDTMGLAAEVAHVVRDATLRLPPPFIAMLAVNVVFILGLLWFMHDIAVTRITAVTRIFDACTTALAPREPKP